MLSADWVEIRSQSRKVARRVALIAYWGCLGWARLIPYSRANLATFSSFDVGCWDILVVSFGKLLPVPNSSYDVDDGVLDDWRWKHKGPPYDISFSMFANEYIYILNDCGKCLYFCRGMETRFFLWICGMMPLLTWHKPEVLLYRCRGDDFVDLQIRKNSLVLCYPWPLKEPGRFFGYTYVNDHSHLQHIIRPY